MARRCGRRGRRAGRPGEAALSAVTVSQACPTPAGRTRRARRGSGCGKLLCSGAALRHLGYRDFFQAPRCWLSYFCHSVRVTVTFGHLPEFSAEPRCCKSSLAMSWNSSSVQCRAGQDRQGWEGGRGGGSSGPSRCLPPQRAWRRATLSLSPSGTPVTALLSRAGPAAAPAATAMTLSPQGTACGGGPDRRSGLLRPASPYRDPGLRLSRRRPPRRRRLRPGWHCHWQ